MIRITEIRASTLEYLHRRSPPFHTLRDPNRLEVWVVGDPTTWRRTTPSDSETMGLTNVKTTLTNDNTMKVIQDMRGNMMHMGEVTRDAIHTNGQILEMTEAIDPNIMMTVTMDRIVEMTHTVDQSSNIDLAKTLTIAMRDILIPQTAVTTLTIDPSSNIDLVMTPINDPSNNIDLVKTHMSDHPTDMITADLSSNIDLAMNNSIGRVKTLIDEMNMHRIQIQDRLKTMLHPQSTLSSRLKCYHRLPRPLRLTSK